MDDVLAASASRRRMLATLSLVFAIGATLLAAIGLYGLIAYATSQRTQEIGVRLALGATPRTVIAGVAWDALRLVLVGVIGGAVACRLFVRLITPLLFGVAWTDPATVVGATVAVIGVAMLASVVPAVRASSVNPVIALRAD